MKAPTRRQCVCLFLFVIIPVWTNGRSSDSKNHLEYMQGLSWMGRGRYDSAIASFKNVIDHDAYASGACVRICESYSRKKAPDEGLSYFKGLVKNNPENPCFRHGLGLMYRETKDETRALEQFRLAVRSAPAYAGVYRDFLDALNKMNRLGEAEPVIKSLHPSVRGHAAVRYALAYLAMLQNRPGEALKNADLAIDGDGGFLDAYHLKGILLSGTGRYGELFDISREGYGRALGAGDAEFQCRLLGNMGYAKYFLAGYPESLEYNRKALALAVEYGLRPEEIRSLQYIGNACRDTGRLDEALDSFNRALKVSVQTGDRRSEGSSARLIGTVYSALCDFLEARKYYQRALPIAVETGNDNLKALTLHGLGTVNWNLGDYATALTDLDEALRISEKRNDFVVEQMCLGMMGLVHWNLGHFSQSLECHEKALAIARTCGLKLWEGVHLGNMAVIFQCVGDYSTALTYQDQALRIAVETGSKDVEGMNLNNMASIYSDRLKQYDKAMDLFRKALHLAVETRNKRLEVEFLGSIGSIFAVTGRTARADSCFQEALKTARRIGHKGDEALELMNLGELYDTMGDLDRAMSYYRNSLAMAERLSDPGIVLKCHLGIGTVYEKQGHDEQALKQYRKAIDGIEGFRDRLGTDELKTFFMENAFGAFEKIIHLLHALHRRFPQKGYDGQAFEYAEMAKARSFLDIVYQADIFQNLEKVPRVLREQVASNANLLSRNYQSLSEAVQEGAAHADPARVSRIEQTIQTLHGEKTRLLDRIRRNHPEYYELTHPRLISADAVRRDHLNESQMLVEYFIGDADMYVWTLTRQKMSFQSVGMNRSGIEKCLAQISPLFLRQRRDPSAAMDHRWANIQNNALHRLYKTLLQVPAGNDLLKCREILIVADDLLNYFPFEMLVTGIQGKKVRYLIEDHPLSYFCSSSFLDRGQESGGEAGRNLIAFGNPFFRRTWMDKIRNPAGWFKSDKAVLRNESFQPLPNSEREVKAISAYFPNSSVYTGKNATEERFKKLAGEYRNIHLATHFITSDLRPMLSKIVLSQDRRENEDGYLQMYEVYNLALKADLAVLSGCNTGMGELRRGEGLIGISRAFFYAGASSLIVSLWPVEDESTALLMKSFYGHLGAGMNKSHALQQAKIDLIRSTDAKRDPFYWGPFVLIEGGR